MNTPGTIATNALTGYPLGRDITREDVWQLIHDAIEADRAQRERITESDMDDMLSEWEDFAGDVSYFYSKWAALLSDDRQEWIENRIAELTREWEDAVNYGRDEDEPYHRAADYALSEDDWRAGLDADEAAEIARLIDWRATR